MMLVAVAWIYVVLMVAVVEATGPQGTLGGALVTFLFYGVLPLGIVMYLLLSPARRRRARGLEPLPPTASGVALDPDGRGHPPGDAVAAEREEP